MKYKKLGRTDIEISAVIMGTWQAGKDMWAGINDEDSRIVTDHLDDNPLLWG